MTPPLSPGPSAPDHSSQTHRNGKPVKEYIAADDQFGFGELIACDLDQRYESETVGFIHPAKLPDRPVLSPKASTGTPNRSSIDRYKFVSGVSRG
jgi:hypothetical protein